MDGTGSPWYSADLGIHNGRIAAIGRLRDATAKTVIDARNLPAQRLGLTERGVLKQGLWADVVIFDPEQIHDVATFENPNQVSVGMQYVLVNGVPVIAGGKATQALPGKVLRGPGYLQ